MNRCKICGEPCGIYEICRQCQKDIEDGKVIICPFCGKYHLADKKCTCQDETKTQNTNQNQENININIESEDDSAFSKGFGGTMGVGCGCLAIIAIVILVIVLSGGAILEGLF